MSDVMRSPQPQVDEYAYYTLQLDPQDRDRCDHCSEIPEEINYLSIHRPERRVKVRSLMLCHRCMQAMQSAVTPVEDL